MRKILVMVIAVFLMTVVAVSAGHAENGVKIGYIDSKRVLYGYEKTKTYEGEINTLTQKWQAEREKKIESIRQMRDEIELLGGEAKTKKQLDMEGKIAELNEYDRNTRQQLLGKQNEMFRELMDDINNTVKKIGDAGKYDYIFDSRNMVYKKENADLTEKVIEDLNRK